MHDREHIKDEELGKRDDGFKPKNMPTANSLTLPWRWRKRRVFTVLAALILLYLAVTNFVGSLASMRNRLGAPIGSPAWSASQATGNNAARRNVEPKGAPPGPRVAVDDEESEHYFDGPIRFYRLAASLHGIARTMGSRPQNRNVLYAASSLRSAANLIPMACEMAKWDRNHVHMAFLGRDSVSLETILEVNGVDGKNCAVFFHDARSDFSEWSSDQRAEISVAGAMKHINDFMHPQAVVMDDSAMEDRFFTRAMRSKSAEIGRPLIEVPAGRYEEFMWMTRLDSGSLSNWFKPTIEILVHAPPDSSGGLVRLLRSLQSAAYSGFPVPKLTVELSTNVEPFVKRYLERLSWPPGIGAEPWQPTTLSLRHRIATGHFSSEQASVRFVESFFPSNRENNHVLVLSAQADVAPLFMQYLMYSILEYKYSTYGAVESGDLLGISLDVPSTHINGSAGFVPPSVSDMNTEKYTDPTTYDQNAMTPFLYQTPSAAASLIFGDKWTIFHNFLSNRMTASHLGEAEKQAKLVSEAEPAWLEYLLELMRARGWTMLHPSVPYVTVHNDLAQVPEEYMRSEKSDTAPAEEKKAVENADVESFLLAAEAPVMLEHIERRTPDYQPLHQSLAFNGDLPELSNLPFISHEGELLDVAAMMEARNNFIPFFRKHIGGCKGAAISATRAVSDPIGTEDMFCLSGTNHEQDVANHAAGAEAVAEIVIAETTTARAEGGAGMENKVEADHEEKMASGAAQSLKAADDHHAGR
ncbi:hypothetical protein LTR62_006006 [Meristemomyces frigidus]|uniref:Glycosyltransferase 2 n=1 Tax=Meristemomyces frigidus TaxID=1508187 RepID=A0AAN7TPA5_9PEZI|nr:hypothetical protein LTR62_006006 [Meristemomyces frigidus]